MSVESHDELKAVVPLPILPNEIIQSIIRYSDVPTACCFARAARRFGPTADEVIWRCLHLVLNEDFHPLLMCKEALKAMENQFRTKTRAKVKAVIMQADRRRWRSVREVVMMPRPGSIHGIMTMLEMVCDNLRKLEIRGVIRYYRWIPKDHDTFDFQMLNCGITFPLLNHVRLLDGPLRFHGFIPLLCNAAPHLKSLHADLTSEPSDDDPYGESLDPPFPTFDRPTRIQDLRLLVAADRDFDDHPRWADLVPDILKNCPVLEVAAISCHSQDEEDISRMGRELGGMGKLETLIWSYDISGEPGSDDGAASFSGLRRLVSYGRSNPIMMVPELPQLETLLHMCYNAPSYENILETPPSAVPFLPSLALQLRNCPRLSEFRRKERDDDDPEPFEFADVEKLLKTAVLCGIISSYIHGKEEVLHARLLEVKHETSDLPIPPHFGWRSQESAYIAIDGTERVKTFAFFAPGTNDQAIWPVSKWRDCTDWGGMVVPLGIIDEMRVVQGASEEEWKKRGVQVGDAAWKVLLDWKEGEEVV